MTNGDRDPALHSSGAPLGHPHRLRRLLIVIALVVNHLFTDGVEHNGFPHNG